VNAQTAHLIKQGDAKDDAGKPAEALALYTQAKQLTPDNPGLYVRIANVANKLDLPETGLDALKTLMRLRPEAQNDSRVTAMKLAFESRITPNALKTASPQAPPPPANESKLSQPARMKYEALQMILKDLDSTPDEAVRRHIWFELLDKTGELVLLETNNVHVWGIRAEASLAVQEPVTAWEAGQHLLALKADTNENLGLQGTLAKLERNGLLEAHHFNVFPLSGPTINPSADTNAYYTLTSSLIAEKEFELVAFWFRKASEQGLAEAQLDLGDWYYRGTTVPNDFVEAAKWYGKAAEQGNPTAQYKLGFCYAHGRGVTTNFTRAVMWYNKAANQGDAMAQYHLGLFYDDGTGVKKEPIMAVFWLRKAANQGVARAQYQLGYCYYFGTGIQQDFAEAAKWFDKAAEQGLASAQFSLGVCYADGTGVAKDSLKALTLLFKAANQGNASAQKLIGYCYENGRGLPENSAEARKWYRKAADQGDAEASTHLLFPASPLSEPSVTK
jgi:TPR repeat protein